MAPIEVKKAIDVYVVMMDESLQDAFDSFEKAIDAIRGWTETDGEIVQQETYDGTKLQVWDFLSYEIHELKLS